MPALVPLPELRVETEPLLVTAGGLGARFKAGLELDRAHMPSTYLLVGLAKVGFGGHQKFTIKWTVLTSLLMLLANLVFGVVPLRGGA